MLTCAGGQTGSDRLRVLRAVELIGVGCLCVIAYAQLIAQVLGYLSLRIPVAQEAQLLAAVGPSLVVTYRIEELAHAHYVVRTVFVIHRLGGPAKAEHIGQEGDGHRVLG